MNKISTIETFVHRIEEEVNIFNIIVPRYFIRIIKYYEYKYFLLTAKKAHCVFNYNGLDLIVGKKTFNGHAMLMLIGNEMHDVGTLDDEHFPDLLKDSCPPPEETAYSCFLKYSGFANTCFSAEARDHNTLY